MEKDLKDKKPAENGTPKVPWTKMIPAAAVIAALAFSGPDETYPVICRFWQNGRPVEISYTRDGFNDVSDMIPSLVHAGTGAAKGKPVRLSFEDFDEEYRKLFGGAGQKKP